MPYTPPSQRSPAASASTTPNVSRRSSSSYQPAHSVAASPHSTRPELPRSTSYLTRHRRTPSVKTASFINSPTTFEPTPPGTADSEDNDASRIKTNNSLRQSPPPVTDDTLIPTGAVLSPPDSVQNSSDDEDNKVRGRELSNLAELQAAIRNIGQRRESSPDRHAVDIGKANQALTLQIPSKVGDISPTLEEVERALSQGRRKISHTRSNTDSPVFLDLRQDPSETPSEEDEEDASDDEPDRSRRRKPPMLRKKSGELVRPALRPSSSRRRPSSMPGTPTFSKAVHFDQHLEHVRHFLQVDRPLAVSASSSPVENYESDAEFPFSDEDSQQQRGPPFEWEIVVSNFPPETPNRLRRPIRVERVFLSADNKTLVGSVAVANLAFQKTVVARFTLDYWKTTSEVLAEYNNDVRRKQHADGYDRFNFNIKLADQANLEAKTMFFCVKYAVNGVEYWDNNNSTNFQVDFRKKAKPQNGKNGMQPASARPANGLPRSQKKSAPLPRPRSMPVAFDDFADGFDAKYDFSAFAKQPVNDFLGEAGPVRLKGVKSAVNVTSDNQRKSPNATGQAFANRYDFGASLSAAIQAANVALGERSGINLRPSVKSQVAPVVAPTASLTKDSPNAAPIASTGMDSPRPAGSEKPVLASQSYNELLDKYCFFGSVKSSPQLKDGTLPTRSGQYDGNDEGYVLDSSSTTSLPSAYNSPAQQTHTEQRPIAPRMDSGTGSQPSRSPSSAPMTSFVTGTSPMYPYKRHGGFPFNETHAATAIRG